MSVQDENTGYELLRNPRLTKGSAYTEVERTHRRARFWPLRYTSPRAWQKRFSTASSRAWRARATSRRISGPVPSARCN
jgi:hypothetical protein